jgi:hypothetical protein
MNRMCVICRSSEGPSKFGSDGAGAAGSCRAVATRRRYGHANCANRDVACPILRQHGAGGVRDAAEISLNALEYQNSHNSRNCCRVCFPEKLEQCAGFCLFRQCAFIMPLLRPCSLCVLSLSLPHPSILSAIHHGLVIPWASMDLENDRLSVVKDAP